MRVFVDGHLDLAMNALVLRRRITEPLSVVREDESGCTSPGWGEATVTLPELRRGGAVMVVSTLLARVRPWRVAWGECGRATGDFADADMAHACAMAMLDYYRCLEDRGLIRMVRGAGDLPGGDRALGEDEPLALLVTMEGADPVRDPEDLHRWYGLGLRTLMLAHFGRSLSAHGTPSEGDDFRVEDVEGPLTDLGRGLLREMEGLGMALDVSHLSDTSLAEALDRFGGRAYASHCGCRSLVPGCQRDLEDAMIKALAERGGVIGVPLFSPYLVPGLTEGSARETCGLDDVVDHLERLRDVAGTDEAVALGTDMDGGFGLSATPVGIDGSGDLPRLAERMLVRGWDEASVGRVFAGNWLRFWGEVLSA
ncbi:dipeptidase [Mucisphaera calidilacus]|uniref:Membrane dipeptidase (Peptidase family M19) n=1 Tax=Mucisphaera calidilacus TaxID=2527982 RepID=A0A518BTV6_9BACT|nr:membrane dipeptidase [Mucisphaera calidilacus]QDU70412.1 Membrane dipeptidase (Peptidase family M19) [Mucisphaera calidilacus]